LGCDGDGCDWDVNPEEIYLDGLDWEEHEVFGEAYFFLDKGLGVADSGEEAVVARGGEGALADVFFRDEEASALWLRCVLGTVGEEGLEALLDEWCDVDYEGGADVGVKGGIENFVGAVWWMAAGCFDFAKAADEAGLVAEGGGGVVVGMTALPVGKDDDAGTQAAEDGGYLEAVFEGVLDVAVGEIEGFAVGYVEDAGGGVGFGFAVGSGASRAGFALGEIEDAGAPAAGLHGEEGTAAGLFDVVAVGGDG
jgi:hypothetical protein